MRLVNETGQGAAYWITAPGNVDCGEISVDGFVDLPFYDNQTDVVVQFMPTGGSESFSINIANTGTGEQVEMALVAE